MPITRTEAIVYVILGWLAVIAMIGVIANG